MDQNEALSGQGAEENPQGDQTSSNNNAQSMESLLETESLGVDLPQPGEIRTGTIASIVPGQILVSIGAKSEGVISGRELEQLSGEEREAFKVGAQIPVYVVNPEDANGNVVLSFRRAQEQISWENVEKMLEEDRVYESKIIGFNKGGLIVPVGGLRGFLPASQISAVRRSQSTGDTPEQRWQKMVGEPISVRIIEVDRERRRLILSERAATSESRQSIKERVINELVEDQVYTGRVTSLADFGAFVNINGADGLVHLSELSWDRVQHPSEVLEVGQEVKVKVISIDREKKRIGLSIRALADDPWKARIEKFSVGQLVEGVITRLTKFGAFARLEGDIEGLIHISEISEHRIEHPKEVLKEGEVVALRVIRIDPDQHRIGLSLRKVDSAAYADKDFKMLTQELEHAEPEEPAPLSEAGDKAEELGRSGPEESPSPSEAGDKAEELGHSGPEESPSPSEAGDKAEELGHSGPEESPSPSETGGEAKESGTTKPEESPPPPEAGGEDVPASSPQGEG